jgi:hypothetical protein
VRGKDLLVKVNYQNTVGKIQKEINRKKNYPIGQRNFDYDILYKSGGHKEMSSLADQ